MKPVSVLIAAAILATGPVSAVDAPQAQPSPQPENKSDKIVCRTENEIGSMLKKKKICMTVAQWREVNFRSGSAVDHNSGSVPRSGN